MGDCLPNMGKALGALGVVGSGEDELTKHGGGPSKIILKKRGLLDNLVT